MENEKPIWVDDVSRLHYIEADVNPEDRKAGQGIFLRNTDMIEEPFFVSYHDLHRNFTLLSELPENELPENEGGH